MNRKLILAGFAAALAIAAATPWLRARLRSHENLEAHRLFITTLDTSLHEVQRRSYRHWIANLTVDGGAVAAFVAILSWLPASRRYRGRQRAVTARRCWCTSIADRRERPAWDIAIRRAWSSIPKAESGPPSRVRPRGDDELNLIRRGANCGWPKLTCATEYALPSCPAGRSPPRRMRAEDVRLIDYLETLER